MDMPKLAVDKILDYLSSSIICLDPNLKLCHINATGEILFDSSASNLIGRDFDRLFSQVETSTITSKLRQFVQQRQPMTEHGATITLSSLTCTTAVNRYGVNSEDRKPTAGKHSLP